MKYCFPVLLSFLLVTRAQSQHKTENLILITLDGFRWQEVFLGADSALMRQQLYLKDDRLREKFWNDQQETRRELLLPFVWNTMAVKGQLYGNRTIASYVNVTNRMWFSYPGYNELLTGSADDQRIKSNDKIYNPNTTVLEYVNSLPRFKGKVAAFSSWDCFPYIINDMRSGVFVSAGLTAASANDLTDRQRLLNELTNSVPNPLGDVRLDAFTFYQGLEYLKRNKPRVMYFAFDETDDFAHQGEYAAYLNAAHYTDNFIRQLWEYLQSDPQYRDKTTLLITCDHGRGDNAEDWKHHGIKINHADQIWFAAMGPDTPAGGEKTPGQFYQCQVAATLAAVLGLTFNTDNSPCGIMPSLMAH